MSPITITIDTFICTLSKKISTRFKRSKMMNLIILEKSMRKHSWSRKDHLKKQKKPMNPFSKKELLELKSS